MNKVRININTLFRYTCSVTILVTIVLLMLPVAKTVNGAKPFPISNLVYILIVLVAILLMISSLHLNIHLKYVVEKNSRAIMLLSLIAMFAFQEYACYGSFFYTGWDAGTIYETVRYELTSEYDKIWSDYYSQFPNNILLTWIFTAFFKLTKAILGSTHIFLLVTLLNILDVLSLYLLYQIVYEYSKNYSLALCAFLMCALLIGISPWFIIPYSDTVGLIAPLLLLRILQLIKKNGGGTGRSSILLILLGSISTFGYLIKPQIFITSIAIFVYWIADYFKLKKTIRLNKIISKLGIALMGVAIAISINNLAIVPSLQIQLNNNRKIGAPHMLMMGLNNESDGGFSFEDYDFSLSFPDIRSRNKNDMIRAKQRLSQYGFKNIFIHLARKQLVNYGDGTFGWMGEGGFIKEEPAWANNRSSRFLRSSIRYDGNKYWLFLSAKQILWLMTLVGIIGIVLTKKEFDTVNIVVISILGLTAFELLFEARARYLFIYAPFYVLLSCQGYYNILQKIGNRR